MVSCTILITYFLKKTKTETAIRTKKKMIAYRLTPQTIIYMN